MPHSPIHTRTSSFGSNPQLYLPPATGQVQQVRHTQLPDHTSSSMHACMFLGVLLHVCYVKLHGIDVIKLHVFIFIDSKNEIILAS